MLFLRNLTNKNIYMIMIAMKRIVVATLIAALLNTCSVNIPEYKRDSSNWKFAYITTFNTITEDIPYCEQWQQGKWYRVLVARRYANVILMCNKRYGVDTKILTRLIKGESRFKWWARGDYCHKKEKYLSFGPGQVMAHYHTGKMYLIDNGKLGKRFRKIIKQGKEIDYEKYLKRIGYGTEMAAFLIDMWKNDTGDRFRDYGVAICSYGAGPCHDMTRALKNNPAILWDTDYSEYKFVRKYIGMYAE
jgi:hypothetical protein